MHLGRLIAASSLCALLAAALPAQLVSQSKPPAAAPKIYRYHPKQRLPPSLESVQKHLVPGSDAFPDEKEAEELGVRLGQLGESLREHRDRVPAIIDDMLAREFKGGRLTTGEESALGGSPLEIFRSKEVSAAVTHDRTTFRKEVTAILDDFDSIDTAEFLITRIEVTRDPQPTALTTVRFDLAGGARKGWRAQRLGHWRMRWQKSAEGVWRVIEWTTVDDLRSRASAPVFTEATETALGRNSSFRRQLVPGLDYWASHLDAVFTPRGMGHHGVSVGDFNGDGLDDVYVAQPDGLPNRLFRNAGGTGRSKTSPTQQVSRCSIARRSHSSRMSTTIAMRISSSSRAPVRSCSSTTGRATSLEPPARSSSSSRCKAL